jgi:hypothetical protein
MATATEVKKRVEITPVMTQTFKGDGARELAKKALSPETKPELKDGLDWEPAICSQEIESVSYCRGYWKPIYTSVDGVMGVLESDPIGALKDINYGSMLAYNGVVREALSLENSGPAEAAKSFEKQVKEFMKGRAANGKPVSEEKARAIIKALMEGE